VAAYERLTGIVSANKPEAALRPRLVMKAPTAAPSAA
jgi:hypothetical protein